MSEMSRLVSVLFLRTEGGFRMIILQHKKCVKVENLENNVRQEFFRHICET